MIFINYVIVYTLLQGKTADSAASFTSLVADLKDRLSQHFTDQSEKERFFKAFQVKEKDSIVGNDVLTSIALLLEALASEKYDFKEQVTDVIMGGGEGVCVHASVVGGVLGAVLGYSRLPQDWLEQLPAENVQVMNSKLNLLLDLFGLP